ncbi:MAG TPA: CNNM domain-containing protein [Verrucomicrobiae bacterium]|nr:CNNM domain-containing protein [Verrucomicrobiae bacterium]
MSIALVILIVIVLIGFSAVCSGLNVALMSLDMKDLQRKAKLGNIQAKQVIPLRRTTHLTLAAILFTNVAAVSATSLVLESAVYGLLAGLIATLLTVIFGEILPQALFSQKPLFYVAKLRYILKLMIFLTYVVSKPLQLLLDKLFSHEGARLQTRQELGIMISEHLGHEESELDNDEVEIIRGALQLSEKKVRDIMQPISKVFWLTPDTILTDEKIDEIKAAGRSRIPIFNRDRSQCYGVLLMKELVDIDFDEKEYRVDDLNLHPVRLVGSKTALDTMLRKFIASSTHLIPIEKDDRIVGIVTIEDLIEEIVGHEIEDETDRHRQNQTA